MTRTTPALVLALTSALLLSAAVPAAIYVAIDFVSLWGRPPSDHWELYRLAKGGPMVLIVAFGHSLLLGLPLALAMRRRHPMTFLLCVLCGFLIGFVPWFILGQISNFMGSASVGGRDLSVNGIPTLYGIWSATLIAGGMGCLGASGGLAFWIILRLSGIATSGDFASPVSQIWLRTILCCFLVLGLAIAVWKLPDYFEIRSCHNISRNGRNPDPVAILKVDIQQRDWSLLRAIFAQVGTRHGMSLWDDTRDIGGANIMSISLCNEQGTAIEVNAQNWPTSYSGVYIILYKITSDRNFFMIARDFAQSLAAAWPNKIFVQTGKGRFVIPAELLRHEKKSDTEFLEALTK